jgi:hypothetical protein
VSGRVALVATLAYAGYVLIQLPDTLVIVLALLGGLVAAALLETRARARRAWCASFAAIVAALHARVLPAEAPFLTTQLGLAAFVLASAGLTLFSPVRRVKLEVVLVTAVGLGLCVGMPVGAGAALAGATGGALAGMRPLSALEAIVHGRSADPWLAWAPVASASSDPERGDG